MSLAVTAAAVAGTAALGAYLDGKFHITKDVSAILGARYGEKAYSRAVAEGRGNAWFIFQETAQKYPDMVCMWSRDGIYTYRDFYNLSCQYANFFLSQGVKKGDLVALYLQNRPEYIIGWLGLLRIGCAPAAINYNLTGDALIHCLKVSGAKLVLVDDDADCQLRMKGSRTILEGDLGMKVTTVDATFKTQILSFSATAPPEDYALNMKGAFPAILLYTSGTTGMPKGCSFTMERLYSGCYMRRRATGDVEGPNGDRWYSCMPLYHGTAAIAMFACLVMGVGIAIGRKFSVRNFWKDIHDSDSTVFIYVGETARYLLAAPPSPAERNHRVRCMYGNGLRPDIWEKCQERFGIPEVAEFFNSTEGIFGLFVRDKGPFLAGCVGHHGLLLRRMFHNVYVPVEIDPTTGDVLRDSDTGFAIRAPYEKGGEMLVAIPSEGAFQGYWRNEAATSKKFLRDMFRKGDLFYRSGDALRRSEDGKWFFLDRLGDTFRWKSENVSTAEVAEVIGRFPGVQEANVYGVLVPGHEGRAGCVALQIEPGAKQSFDYKALARFARDKLPRYAVPVFLRVVNTPVHIHNNKQNKVPLREEGVDPEKIGTKVTDGKSDRFLWLAPGQDGYVDFGKDDWGRLSKGAARL